MSSPTKTAQSACPLASRVLCLSLAFAVGLCAPLPLGCKPGAALTALDGALDQVVEAQAALDLVAARMTELGRVPAVGESPAYLKALSALSAAREALSKAATAARSARAAGSYTDAASLFIAFRDAWALLDAALAVVDMLATPKAGTGSGAQAGVVMSYGQSLRVPAPSAAR